MYVKVTSGELLRITAFQDNIYCKKGEVINIHNPMFWFIQDNMFDAEFKIKLMNQVEAFTLDNRELIMLRYIHENFN